MQRLIAAGSFVALVLVATLAVAAENPSGTWKWKMKIGDREIDRSLTLKLDGDKLTGTMPGREGKETAIEDGSFKDNVVTFKITRERGDKKFTSKYTATVSGDTLKGKVESERD